MTYRGNMITRTCRPALQTTWSTRTMDCLFRVISVFVLVTTAGCTGSPTEELIKLQQEFFDWRTRDRPMFGTSYDVNMYSDKIESFNITMFSARKEVASSLQTRLLKVKVDQLTKKDKLNFRILQDMLTTYIDGYKWAKYSYLNPVTYLEGPQLDTDYVIRETPFKTKEDFKNYISRMQLVPQQFAEYKALMREAIRLERTNHVVSLRGIERQFEVLQGDATDSIFYTPFVTLLGSTSIPESEKETLRQDAREAVTNLLAAFQDLKNFIVTEYKPRTRSEYGVRAWDNGAEFYKARMKYYTSVDLTPEYVHQLGLNEVQRIATKIQQIMKKHGYGEMKIYDYFSMLMNQSHFFYKTGNEILAEYRRIMLDVIDPKLANWFKNLPGLPIEVHKMGYDGPLGMYSSGTADGSKPGIFWVNVIRPSDIVKFGMMALCLHEGSPGHHLQISYALTATRPDFLTKQEWSADYRVPFAMPRHEAFVEGWALYSEALGEEMGVYGSDYEMLGRYSSEIFRACRLVVDTGIHYFRWDRDRAIDYMLNYTAETRPAIENEVDRYITWPGQALAYKVGELRIKHLREKAEKALGNNFNIKDFHSAVLENGYLPLHLLDVVVDDYIATSGSSSTRLHQLSTTASYCVTLVLLSTICYSRT